MRAAHLGTPESARLFDFTRFEGQRAANSKRVVHVRNIDATLD
jgi:hypothetical protein